MKIFPFRKDLRERERGLLFFGPIIFMHGSDNGYKGNVCMYIVLVSC